MPIGFCRLEYVKRSSSKNACAKAAYNSRSRIEFKGTKFADPKLYDWSFNQTPTHHEVLLPDHVDQKFQSPEFLWNIAEQKENRKNSQPAFEMVIALPDDVVISIDDRIKLTRDFVQKHVVDKGLAAQIDIHPPEKKIVTNRDGKEFVSKDHNWHAHVLVTTRRFNENGQELADHKARDLMPVVRNGKVIAGENWGKLWTQFQNQYFEDKGLSLRVDQEGIVSQKHLGPVRLRGRAFDLLSQHEMRIGLNKLESEDPLKI